MHHHARGARLNKLQHPNTERCEAQFTITDVGERWVDLGGESWVDCKTSKNKHLTFRDMCDPKCVKNAHITRGGVFASKYVERKRVCVSAHALFA